MATNTQYKNNFWRQVIEIATNELSGIVDTQNPGGGTGGNSITEGTNYDIGDFRVSNENILNVKLFYLNQGWWIVRFTADGSEIAPSGINIKDDSRFENLNIPSGITISSPNTAYNGLEPPATFPFNNFLAFIPGYVRDGNIYVPDENASNEVSLASRTETQTNRYDFSNDFENSWDYSKFKAMAAFQFPIYRGQTGLLEPFKAGWNYAEFADYYPSTQGLTESHVRFFQIQWQLSNGNLFSVANSLPSEYIDLKNAILNKDFLTANNQSNSAWEMLGASLSSYVLGYTDVSTNQFSWSGASLFDDEVNQNGNGGLYEQVKFIAKCVQYVNKSRPNSAVIHYGYPANSVHWNQAIWYKDTDVSSLKTEQPMGVPKPSLPYYFDGTVTYTKSPLPVTSTIYQKDGSGNYVLDSGNKRKLRTDAFSEYQFGVKNTWHPQFWNHYQNNYVPFENVDPPIININTGVKCTDMEFAVAFPYRLITMVKLVMANIANQEGSSDYTRFKPSIYKPISVQSLLTEPFTTGGNSPWRRWVSEDQIKFNFLAPLFAGYDGVYCYEDGYVGIIYYNPDFGNPNSRPYQLPTKGNQLTKWWYFENYGDFSVPVGPETNFEGDYLPITENLSRFNWVTTAIATMRAIMANYTKDTTLRFLHFNEFGGGIDGREIIMIGMYQGTNMHILAYYPFQDATDSVNITFNINGTTYIQTLNPRKCEIYHFEGSFGAIEPSQVKATYNNIDGTQKKVTGDPSSHFFS